MILLSVPSRTATAEFVVPKSIPIILDMCFSPYYLILILIFLDIPLKWWGREQLPTGFHHLFLSLLSQKSPISPRREISSLQASGLLFIILS